MEGHTLEGDFCVQEKGKVLFQAFNCVPSTLDMDSDQRISISQL